MDDRRFDALTRSLAAGASRRRVLKGLFGGLIGGAALGGAGRTYAEDEEPPVVETDESTEPVTDQTPPVDDTAPEGDTPPAGDPPPADDTPPEGDPPADDTPPEGDPPPADEPPAEPVTDTADEGTPTDPAGPSVVVCNLAAGQIACDSVCCDPGWRCCGIYCIPDGEDSCCSDTECDPCELCGVDGVCYPFCDAAGLECCVDEKQGAWYCADCCLYDPECLVDITPEFCRSIGQEYCDDGKGHATCAWCCDNSDCHEYFGACATCYGGYCLSCFDQTGGDAPICAIDECADRVAAGDDSGGYCVQCCADYQCGPCERCNYGWCEYACDYDEHCCETVVDTDDAGSYNGGICAHCCGREDCGDCESCYEGHCRYDCDPYQVCCHGEYCAWENDGCCGVQGNWCDPQVAAADHLNGSCCDGFTCCWDDKSKSGTCAECCDDYDCGPTPGIGGTGYCCGGVCVAECCDDKDCEWGVCVDGYCADCRDNYDCGYGKICCSGECVGYECCYESDDDPVNCGECETCLDGWCRPSGVELYGACNPMYVTAVWDESSPQLNCCNGLVCCDSHKYGLVCLECCGDQDCAHGCTCEDGFCSCGCSSDKDCGDGTCCCKNGSCSKDCCAKPPKPHKPHKPSTSTTTTTVTTLPGTGSGDKQEGSGWLGAAALGAAAAYLASRKLRPEATPEAETPEE